MNLSELFQRWFNEQQWREQQAKQFATPLHDGRDLTLAERFTLDPRTNMLMGQYATEEEDLMKETGVLNNMTRDVGTPPKYFFERNSLNQLLDHRLRQNSKKQGQLL